MATEETEKPVRKLLQRRERMMAWASGDEKMKTDSNSICT